MNPTARQEIPREVRDLLAQLATSDQETEGQPRLPPEQLPLAREWLAQVLTDSNALVAHVELLEDLYGETFRWPQPRRCRGEGEVPATEGASGFRHNRTLPQEGARAVAEHGLGVLTGEELARLLLDPFALWDIGDLINALLPDYWLGRLAEAGRQLIAKYHLEVAIPGDGPNASEK